MNFSFCTVVKDKPFSQPDKIDQTAGFIIIRHPATENIPGVSGTTIKLVNQSYLGNNVFDVALLRFTVKEFLRSW